MAKDINFISDINEKYTSLECDLESKLKMIVKTEQTLELKDATKTGETTSCRITSANSSCNSFKQRNFELMKSLEISKARLRSRATFSPLEIILQKAIGNYLKDTSLIPCSTKKIYGPTYV
ncbi:uncharacterized protein LOC128723012 [Anopheles nili]|uniref:uncharacterized protein LOC128723012 n=1 Tax=Anopheles nili TaxID=185578 RepID=UPI00237C0210|nr:uncharacterized protein LOC128723012 [Anopheles nili]